MKCVRTPESRFEQIPDFPNAPGYVDIPAGDGDTLRMAWVEEGPSSGEPVLMLHGEPSWSFLYRKTMRVVGAAGLRAIAPDLIGFGRSDKPCERGDYTYRRHVDWLLAFLDAMKLDGITLLCQDWGGLIGLRLVGEHPDRFARVVAANTFLPTGDRRPPAAFFAWQSFSQNVPELPVGKIVGTGCARGLAPEIVAAYDAPFPDESYKAGARQFPMLVPSTPDNPASAPNRRAWETLARFDKPFLTAFGDSDPITSGGDRVLQEKIPGARGRAHVTLARAGHFLQEDAGEELGRVVVNLVGGGRGSHA